MSKFKRPHRLNERTKTFKLVRKEDVSGVSGAGVIAEGVVFHDGVTIISWYGKIHSREEFPCVADLIKVHGHGGKTEIVWDK